MKKHLLLCLAIIGNVATAFCQSEPDEQTKIKNQFNWIYTNSNDTLDIFSKEPNAFMARIVENYKPGKALDVAMGEGRNSIYLARKGWDVTGFDIAAEGLKIANEKAEKLGLEIKTSQQSYDQFDFGAEKWDLVLLSYAWVPLLDSGFVNKLVASMKKGGILILEHPLDSPSDAPSADSEPNAILNSFIALHVRLYEDTNDISDWRRSRDERKTNKFRTIRLLASKR